MSTFLDRFDNYATPTAYTHQSGQLFSIYLYYETCTGERRMYAIYCESHPVRSKI